MNVPKYKRLFGIKGSLSHFCPSELKRRWRILCKKYHPDHGGAQEHFEFVQEAYAYLKKYCKGTGKKEPIQDIEEIEVKLGNGDYMYIWDTGYPPNPKKRHDYETKHPHRFRGRNLNIRI